MPDENSTFDTNQWKISHHAVNEAAIPTTKPIAFVTTSSDALVRET